MITQTISLTDNIQPRDLPRPLQENYERASRRALTAIQKRGHPNRADQLLKKF